MTHLKDTEKGYTQVEELFPADDILIATTEDLVNHVNQVSKSTCTKQRQCQFLLITMLLKIGIAILGFQIPVNFVNPKSRD